jgi:hypothetical protein
LRRGFAAAGIHAHVERGIEAEAETARRIVQLRRRNTEIEQHTVDATGQGLALDQFCERRERAMDCRHTHVMREPMTRRLHRLRIPIHGEQPTAIA